jgi:glycosyltransferase involved in cell wall biosynthesis
MKHNGPFVMAPAEGMACGCVPVVTDRGALPEVVGDTGFYVPYGDEKATAEAIKKALNSDKGKKSRDRIKKMVPIERREKDLKEIIKEMAE